MQNALCCLFLTEDVLAPQHDSYAILRISKNRVRRNNRGMKTTMFEIIPCVNANARNRMKLASFGGPALIAVLVGWFGFLPAAHAQLIPPPDGCYSNFTTAEGCEALNFLTTGAGNTAIGWRSLFSNTDGSFNTGVGGGALVLNNGTSNTAVGAAALLLNTTGGQNTAVGTDTLVFNDSGSSNTATGYFALANNTTGSSNTAMGWEALTANTTGVNNVALGTLPLSSNTTGNNNTALGNLALEFAVDRSDHVCVGRHAGDGITTVDNNIIIGHNSGVHPDPGFGQISDRCFIDNIHGAPVSSNFDPQFVMVDSAGRLGTFVIAGADPGGFSPKKGISPKAIPDAAKQAMLNLKVEKLQETVMEQRKQMETLMAQLKEQAEQIQKVNALIQFNNSAARTVAISQ
jgi:hypothetical protein